MVTPPPWVLSQAVLAPILLMCHSLPSIGSLAVADTATRWSSSANLKCGLFFSLAAMAFSEP